MHGVDLRRYLGPSRGEVRAAWRLPDGRWQLTVLRASARVRRLRTYDVDVIGGVARLVGELGHCVGATRLTEHRRLMRGSSDGAAPPAIVIPRRMQVGQVVSVVDGAAEVCLRWRRTVAVAGRRIDAVCLAARERGGGTGAIVLAAGLGEVKIEGAEPRRAVYLEAGGRRIGRMPAWWASLRAIDVALAAGAARRVL